MPHQPDISTALQHHSKQASMHNPALQRQQHQPQQQHSNARTVRQRHPYQAAAPPQRPVCRRRQPQPVCASCASGARALPSVTCRTIVKVNSPEDLQVVLQGNDLVAEMFYNASDNALVDAIQFNSYRLRSAAQTLGLHMAPSCTHATIVAFAADGGAAAAALQDGGGGGAWRQPPDAGQKAVGIVNVSLMQATPTIATAAACAPGTPFAMVTNMAVAPAARRQGVARQLMQAAVKTALVDLDVCVPFVLLLAYKYYEPAMRLYESWGFQATPWVDPAWQEEAEKGRTARQRRVMLVKQLSGAGMAAGRAAA